MDNKELQKQVQYQVSNFNYLGAMLEYNERVDKEIMEGIDKVGKIIQ